MNKFNHVKNARDVLDIEKALEYGRIYLII